MCLSSGYILTVQALIKPGCKHTFWMDLFKAKWCSEAQAAIIGHVLNDFRLDILRQYVLRNASLLYSNNSKHRRWEETLSWGVFQAGPPPPLEAILAIFGRSFLNLFCWKGLGKIWKLTPLLCTCAVASTLETQKCRKKAPCFVEFNFFTNRNRRKQFSQNERRADLQNVASKFLIFAWGLSYDLSKFSDDFTPFFPLWKTITKSLGKN